jgi:hypothetical protein
MIQAHFLFGDENISHFKDRHEEISDIHPVRALNFGEIETL